MCIRDRAEKMDITFLLGGEGDAQTEVAQEEDAQKEVAEKGNGRTGERQADVDTDLDRENKRLRKKLKVLEAMTAMAALIDMDD